VLIVEDDEDARELLGWCMRAAGWIVTGAADAESALLVAAGLAPDAIVMDLGLPGITGLDAIRRLKNDEHTRDVPVVVCTALSPAQAEPRAWEAGCDAFLAKPCEPEDMRRLLERMVAHRRGPIE
jgi:two-component system, cell cycle response regulator DivK